MTPGALVEEVFGTEWESELELEETWHFSEGWNNAVSCLEDSQCMLYLLSRKSSSCRDHCHYICSIEPFQGFVFVFCFQFLKLLLDE